MLLKNVKPVSLLVACFMLVCVVDAWTICFSPDARLLASGSHTGKINLYGVESGKKESALDTRGKFTLSIAYVSCSLMLCDLCPFHNTSYHRSMEQNPFCPLKHDLLYHLCFRISTSSLNFFKVDFGRVQSPFLRRPMNSGSRITGQLRQPTTSLHTWPIA